MRTIICTVLIIGAASHMVGQVTAQRQNFILLVVPESDTTVTSSPVYRLSASTLPGSRVSINDRRFNVYASGAFAGLLDVTVGENVYRIVSVSPDSATVTKSFVIRRMPPVQSTRDDTLAIEPIMMLPSDDVWLNDGDLLECQCKGTPGCVATFMNGRPMRELAPEEARGLRGIYRGVYRVTASDSLQDFAIRFRLQRGDSAVTGEAPGHVSFKAAEFPLIAVTRGDRTPLYYGTGEDRLGGAVISHLVQGVRLAINGKIGREFRVALSPGQEAWVDRSQVELLPAGTFVPSALTGDWNVYGDDTYDYIFIGIGEKLPYVSTQDFMPTRILIDLFGATSNSNWITQRPTTREIKNVSYRQIGKGHLQLIIELKHHQVWGFEISYVPGGLLVKIRRQPAKLKIKALTFALDAGHGGDNLGAVGSTGALEKDINLATVVQLKRLLEDRGAKVVLTRNADTNITMRDRVKKAVTSGADIVIAIHSNSIGDVSNPIDVKGVSTYYKYLCYRPLSSAIMKQVLKTGLTSAGNVGSFNFALNSPVEVPNVLVELAFMSNPEDEMKLLDPDFRKTIAERIVDGIDDFLDGCEE